MDPYWGLTAFIGVCVLGGVGVAGWVVGATSLTLNRRAGIRWIGWSMLVGFLLALVFGVPALVLWISGLSWSM